MQHNKRVRTFASDMVPMILCLASTLATALSVSAQCANVWLPGNGVLGVNGSVFATVTWDPDGAGPAAPVLVVGGAFTLAGNALANNIASYDFATSTWSALGSGMDGSVRALTTSQNGDLVAAGRFTIAGGVNATCIARWNGTSWGALGAGLSGPMNLGVSSLATLANGDLVAGGDFAIAAGASINYIARWDGVAWSALGSGLSAAVIGSGVYALRTLPNGDLVAAGAFPFAGGVSVNGIARWDGASWSAFGSGLGQPAPSFPAILAMATAQNGDLVIGGNFWTVGGVSANNLARWNGTSWSAMGGMSSSVESLTRLATGDLVAGGNFLGAVAQWNGTSWLALGAGIFGHVHALTTLPTGDLVVGGAFASAGGVGAKNVARWGGTQWSALGAGASGAGVNDVVHTLLTLPSGEVIAGGRFTAIGGTSALHIARWNGTQWASLGSGMTDMFLYASVNALTRLPNGDLVAGGRFNTAGGVTANGVARWNGTSWSPLGAGVHNGGVPGIVDALAILPNGDLVAGGRFNSAGSASANRIARWDGTTWLALGSGMNGIYVDALATLPNGDLVAGGYFTTAGGVNANNIARWDGSAWGHLGAGTNGEVYALLAVPNGDLIAAGWFGGAGSVSAQGIARWNGTSWAALGVSTPFTSVAVLALTRLPNGDLIAGGLFTHLGGVSAQNIVRWNGVSWSALGSGLNNIVRSFTAMTNGDVLTGGDFFTAGGNASAYLARLTTSCPATATTYGAGCTGSAGPVALAATSLPWVGGTLRATTTGLTTNSLAVGMFGFGQISIPLASVHPQGQPGCLVYATDEILIEFFVSSGAVQSQRAIPNAAALIGAAFYHQVVPVELDMAGHIQAITSSNALALTIGSF